MRKSPVLAILGLSLLLAACTPEEEESVEERFRRTEAAIANTAAELEAESENAVREVEMKLDNEAAAFGNRTGDTNMTAETDGNQTR